jgi:5'-nucleotidase
VKTRWSHFFALAVALAAFSFTSCAGGASVPASPAATAAPSAQPAIAPTLAPELAVEAAPISADKPLSLRILHLSDTHSKFEPTQLNFTFDLSPELAKKRVYVEMGGYARLKTLIDSIKRDDPAAILLHSGDAVQGTLYFTKFGGRADVEVLNMLGVEAAAIGNHEFDKGPEFLAKNIIAGSNFPWLAANIDASAEPALKGLISPYALRDIDGVMVGIVGMALPTTDNISSPGKNLAFQGVEAVQAAVDELTESGVKVIILLSHCGYDYDLEMAPLLKGVDVILGGHSHTLGADVADLGLATKSLYPVELKGADGKPVIVAHDWEWGKVLGNIKVDFDAAGVIDSFDASPFMAIGDSFFRIYDVPNLKGELKRVQYTVSDSAIAIKEYDGKGYNVEIADDPMSSDDQYDAYFSYYVMALVKILDNPASVLVRDDPEVAAVVAGYAKGVDELKAIVATEASVELKRGNNMGPGPIIADSMTAKTGADVAIMNPGGVRIDLPQGKISVAQVYELQPFGNTLVTLKLSGADLVRCLEDMIDFGSGNGKDFSKAIAYVSGMTATVLKDKPKYERVVDVKVKGAPLDPAATYTLVVNNFMATGGDSNVTLGKLGGKYDTGFIDSEAMLEYVSGKVLAESGEVRLAIQ